MYQFKISIIVPCYNASPFIRQLSYTADNQLNTNRGGNLQLIFVNDGSTDDTLSGLRAIECTHPNNVIVVDKTNGGVASARNTGLDIATGEWIGFLDSDDVLAPGSIAFLLDNLNNVDADIVNYESKSSSIYSENYEDLKFNIIDTYNGRDYYLVTKSIVVWKYLYRNDYLKRHSIRFHDITIGEDTLFNFEALMANGKVCHIDTIVTYHIDREGSLTTSTAPSYVRKIAKAAVFMQKVYTDYLNQNTVEETIKHKIFENRKRNVRFVFQKLRLTPDMTVQEIKEIADGFIQYNTLPFSNTTGINDWMINYLYTHPKVFKQYIKLYSLLKRMV